MSSDQAFVTLATNDRYAIGALVLAASLKKVNTSKKLAILITKELSESMRKILAQFFDVIQEVDLLQSNNEKLLQALRRPELGVTLTKIHCWKLCQFSKCVFMDADTLVIKNIDELFDYEELSAVPDVGWPDCFNSGVFVFTPSTNTFDNLVDLANREGSFDGGDQGLLNTYFSDWATSDIKRHLSFIYNMTLTSTYSYLPAFKRFGANVKVIHFLGSMKPWNCSYDSSAKKLNTFVCNENAQNFIEQWWQVLMESVHPIIQNMNLTGSMSCLMISGSNVQFDQNRYQEWQKGDIDYLGADSFENIQKRLDASIHGQN
ncbi:Glycogenin-1 [Sarcoptes scabiei]|uniref:glycogenin glucosyltransferase n=1 Tax=Sarcoptes scabiei TaxID=52283 RepID=A0A834R4E5_SARSC|nr:Glycogenin-1 [Sarcoptes scabiei]